MTAGRLSLGPCVAVGVGALSGIGSGVTVPQRATELWLSNSFGALGRYWYGDSAVTGLYANAELPWNRPSFEFSGERFYRPPAVGLVGGWFVGLVLN